jgi:hypothetical protein
MKRTRFALLSLMLAASAACAAQPFAVQAWGNFKQMSHTGDTAGVVKLAALPSGKGNYGLGAIAGMRGEILQWDGRLLVSRGHSTRGETSPAGAADEAVIFVSGKVDSWQEIAVTGDMTQAQFEAFVLASARKLGLDGDKAFPFAVRGSQLHVVWHVVTGHVDEYRVPAGASLLLPRQ